MICPLGCALLPASCFQICTRQSGHLHRIQATTPPFLVALASKMAELIVEAAQSGLRTLLQHARLDQNASGGAWKRATKLDTKLRLDVFESSVPGCSQKVFKAVIELPYKLSTLCREIADLPARLRWDRNIAGLDMRVVKEVPAATAADAAGVYTLFRSATKPVGPISSRDFVDATYIGPFGLLPDAVRAAAPAGMEIAFIHGGSGLEAGHPDFPEVSGVVRGLNHPGCGWVFEVLAEPSAALGPPPANTALPPGHDGWTRVTYVVHSKLNGWLPSSIVNSSMVGMYSSFFGDMLTHMASSVAPITKAGGGGDVGAAAAAAGGAGAAP